jgi:probable selenium-dependent hydroxylase accessory protein YqeC
MMFLELFGAAENIVVIGGGGKTSLVGRLEEECHSSGRPALVAVTTHLGRGQLARLAKVQAGSQEEALTAARRAAGGERLLLAGPRDGAAPDKLGGLPVEWFPALRRAAPADMPFIIEADGSRGLPLKAHRPDEPPLPLLDNMFLTAVIGLELLRRPLPEAVHRPEILKTVLGEDIDDQTTFPGSGGGLR